MPDQEPPRKKDPSAADKPTDTVKTPPSPLFRALSTLAKAALVFLFATTITAMIFALDFLDVIQFRYRLPVSMRNQWPLSYYYDFVFLHTLPEEQRYNELIQREQRRYKQLIAEGRSDLAKRTAELEAAYQELTAAQNEINNKRVEEEKRQQEELAAEKERFAQEKAELEQRQKTLDILAQQLASEAIKIESSLIQFVEKENRLKPMQEMASTMDPRALGNIFNEVTDNNLIYQILQGVNPEQSGKILANMEAEKAGKIMKLSQNPLVLPLPGAETSSFVPPTLQALIASTQANLR